MSKGYFASETLPIGGSPLNRTYTPNLPSFRTTKASKVMSLAAVRVLLPARRAFLLGILLLTLGVVADAPHPLLAHGGATGVVKERMEVMKTIGAAMKRIAAMMHGKQDYDAAAVRDAARTIEALGGDTMTDLFPEGSALEPSEARPVIWEDWNRFQALARDLVLNSRALAEASGNGQDLMGNNRRHGGNRSQGGTHTSQDAVSSDGPNQQPAEVPLFTSNPVSDADASKPMPPPQMAFMRLTRTCAACHEEFRIKK